MNRNSTRRRAENRRTFASKTFAATTFFGTSLIAATLLVAPANAETDLPGLPAGGATESASIEATNETLRTDRLDVTVAKIAGANGIIGTADVDMDIWVGEVEMKGRKAIWVELIDGYGEVIYDAEVRKNETHLLPDGRAIVVRALAEDAPVIAKADNGRVAPDANLVVTRRVVDKDAYKATVEFLEEKEPADDATALMKVARFGDQIWTSVAAFFSSAADNVRFAFQWIVKAIAA